MPALHADLADSIERTLVDEARRNELTIAYVRAVAVALAGLLNFGFSAYPRESVGMEQFSTLNALLSSVWLLVSTALAAILYRGWYRPRLPVLLPFMDAIMVLTMFVTVFVTAPHPGEAMLHPGVLTAAGCVLFAITGALRLTRAAAALTTGLSVLVFAAISAIASYAPAQALFVCAMIVSAGLLAGKMGDIVRRAVEGETSRVILQRFLPASLVNADTDAAMEIISRPRSLEVTVLLSDLRDFTAIAEQLTPREVLEFLNLYQGAFARAVRDHGGTVDKFMGDGLLAVFGAPEPLADHAACAIRAARAMLATAEALNAGQSGRGMPRASLGIGIHSGAVIAGCLGSGSRMEFTVIGDTVNIASRLEANTKSLGVPILISEDSIRQSRNAFPGESPSPTFREVGDVPVRGRGRSIKVYTFAAGRDSENPSYTQRHNL